MSRFNLIFSLSYKTLEIKSESLKSYGALNLVAQLLALMGPHQKENKGKYSGQYIPEINNQFLLS